MRNIVIIAILYFVSSEMACAQADSVGAYDSLYHNYLYDQRKAYFEGLPKEYDGIIFLGNSITHWGDWAELLKTPKAKNRGIAGDISFGILNRLDEVVAEKPSKIFIMIGVNDIGRKIPLSVTLANYRKIIRRLRIALPHTQVFMQSVLPINEKLINRTYYTGTNLEISKMNIALRKLASDNKITYIDLYSQFADKGEMPANYTYDGIHLTASAYILWTNFLKKKGYCCN